MPKSNGSAEVKINGTTLHLSAPIPGRPGVIRIVADDGRQTVLGDHGTFTPGESDALHTVVTPEHKYWKHYLEADERDELQAAEDDLESARRLVVQKSQHLDRARRALQRALDTQGQYAPFGSARTAQPEQPDDEDTAEAERAVNQASEELREARELTQHALVSRNQTRQRLAQLAERRRPDQPSFLEDKKLSSHNWRRRLREQTQ